MRDVKEGAAAFEGVPEGPGSAKVAPDDLKGVNGEAKAFGFIEVAGEEAYAEALAEESPYDAFAGVTGAAGNKDNPFRIRARGGRRTGGEIRGSGV
jgi:hypothetical protein